MKKLAPLLLISLFVVHTAMADKDTLPLRTKTSPPANASAEGPLLKDKKLSPSAAKGQEGPVENMIGPTDDPTRPYVAAVDVFGTSQLTESSLKKLLGNDLNVWIQKGLQNDPASVAMEQGLSKKIQDKFGFASVDWSVIQYFEEGNLAVYITLDVVEKNDVKRRKPFLAKPEGEFPDPENLIKTWVEYETLGLKLVSERQIMGDEQCPAFHCPFGHNHEQLKKFERIFTEGAKKHEAKLVEIFNNDRRGEYRGPAAYLLAYLKDGKKVVEYMVGRIKDPEDLVRNNALRVLGDIAENHPQYVIPPKPVIEALHFPRVTDRSKAIYILHHLVTNSKEAKEEALKTAIPDLLKLLESKQPDHRELAHITLRKISGKEFASADWKAWNRWYLKFQSEGRTVSGKK